jgi:hypothetical protein
MAKVQITKQFEARAKAGEMRKYTLTCITDGGTFDFWDEGPFELKEGKPNPDWRKQDPSGRRQSLLKVLRKRVSVDMGDGTEVILPVFVHAHREGSGRIVPLVMNNDSRNGRPGPCAKSTDDKGKVTLSPADVPPPVWEQVFATEFPIPLADEQWIAGHARLLQNRATAHDRGNGNMNAAVREEQEKRVKAPAAP